jgi:hypothetical protein
MGCLYIKFLSTGVWCLLHLYYLQANYLVESGQQVPEDGDAVRLSALEVEELVKNTVTGALQIVGDVGTLAFSLEASTSPQIDSALQEAQAILEVHTAVF